jgi:hypothetical protein
MTPLQLFDLCTDAIQRWEKDPLCIRSDKPFLLLTVTKARCPRGDKMRAFGKSGPLGRICNVKERSDGKFDVTGYWPVAPIMQQLIDLVCDKATPQTPARGGIVVDDVEGER